MFAVGFGGVLLILVIAGVDSYFTLGHLEVLSADSQSKME
jgi:hypothetical protein